MLWSGKQDSVALRCVTWRDDQGNGDQRDNHIFYKILQSQSLELVTIVTIINFVIGGFSEEDLQ